MAGSATGFLKVFSTSLLNPLTPTPLSFNNPSNKLAFNTFCCSPNSGAIIVKAWRVWFLSSGEVFWLTPPDILTSSLLNALLKLSLSVASLVTNFSIKLTPAWFFCCCSLIFANAAAARSLLSAIFLRAE